MRKDDPIKPPSGEALVDFDLLQRTDSGQAERNRRALWWLLGLLILLLASIITLVLYLRTFEAEEAQRRRIADTQWLEQSVRFHFRRLEDDLTSRALRLRETGMGQGLPREINAGLLWSEPGVVLAHGWLPVESFDNPPAALSRLADDAATDADNARALRTMQDITRGLRRSTYAGPMRNRDGRPGDVIWLAVPVFERGEFAGSYLAALSAQNAVQGLVPAWFRKDHVLRLVDNQTIAPTPSLATDYYLAELSLPGTDLSMQVTPLGAQPAMVPRMFLGAALLFLLGMLSSLYALRRDFNKRQAIESRLQAQIVLRTAMENSVTIGLRAWNLQGQILYVNQAFCRMVGFEQGALVGRSAPLPYWPTDQTDELQVVHQHLISQGTEQAGVELRFQHKDGHLIDVLIHEAPLHGADGAQLGWMSSVLDISERKHGERVAARQQERLEASGRLVAVGEVASTLAHELNQPLGALSSFANGMLNRLREGRISLEEVIPVVERMDRLSDKAGRIIQRVNAFARRREMSREQIDLVVFMRRTLAQYRHRIEPSLGSGPVWVEADALLLEHAVHNVVANALHWATQAGAAPRVRVGIVIGQEAAGIVVGDSGPGVSEAQKEQIFGAFFSATPGGMGMGLAICRSVLEAHRGHIDVGSDPVLGGAQFTLWLPLSGADPAPGAPVEHQATSVTPDNQTP